MGGNAVSPGSLVTNAQININASSNPTLGTNNGTNVNASTSITVSGPGPLPVRLVSFTAQAQPNQTVSLGWTTAWESNNQGYRIDRSKDLNSFELVGEVNEVATSSQTQTTYQLTDPTPFMGTSYYRLTQADLSGKVTVYPAVSVLVREEAYGVYPNPVIGEEGFVLRLDEPLTAELSFVNLRGENIALQRSKAEDGRLLLRPGVTLPPSVYLLTVKERGQIRQHRVVIK